MRIITYEDVLALNPCVDISAYEGQSATAVELLDFPGGSSHDKLWIICREKFVSKEALTNFSLYFANRVIQDTLNIHPICVDLLCLGTKYVQGQMSTKDLLRSLDTTDTTVSEEAELFRSMLLANVKYDRPIDGDIQIFTEQGNSGIAAFAMIKFRMKKGSDLTEELDKMKEFINGYG
jgi:hypothetical protein